MLWYHFSWSASSCDVHYVLLSCCCSTTTLFFATEIKSYTLKNGLHLLVKVNNRFAIFQIWYHVGSIDEPNGISGIAHVLEHMMFEVSKQYPGQAFEQIVANNGGQFNVSTTNDYTVYLQSERLVLISVGGKE